MHTLHRKGSKLHANLPKVRASAQSPVPGTFVQRTSEKTRKYGQVKREAMCELKLVGGWSGKPSLGGMDAGFLSFFSAFVSPVPGASCHLFFSSRQLALYIGSLLPRSGRGPLLLRQPLPHRLLRFARLSYTRELT